MMVARSNVGQRLLFLDPCVGSVSMWSSTCGHAMVEYDIPQLDLKVHGGR